MDGRWVTKSEGVKLIERAVSFQDFQPMCSWSINVTGIPDKRPPDKKPPDKRPLNMPTPDKRPRGQKATKLVFLRRSLESPDCVFFYSTAGEKMTKMTLSVFVAVVYYNRSSF